LDKNVKSREMKTIVRKQLERKLLEPERPRLIARVRGVEIDSTKIDRWMHTHGVSESILYTPSSAACE
jgi:hypothetical protein